MMENPWTAVPLHDYEAHMGLKTIGQLPVLDRMMRSQLYEYPASTVAVFGVAGGNGLRHVDLKRTKTIYGIDINPDYLDICRTRFAPALGDALVLILADVTDPNTILPQAELVIANLFVEYIGYERFAQAVQKVGAKWVSTGIQMDRGNSFVSDSPYLRVFDGVDSIHTQIDTDIMRRTMQGIGYHICGTKVYPLPNGKSFVRQNFEKK
jgi:hypothetical protein